MVTPHGSICRYRPFQGRVRSHFGAGILHAAQLADEATLEPLRHFISNYLATQTDKRQEAIHHADQE